MSVNHFTQNEMRRRKVHRIAVVDNQIVSCRDAASEYRTKRAELESVGQSESAEYKRVTGFMSDEIAMTNRLIRQRRVMEAVRIAAQAIETANNRLINAVVYADGANVDIPLAAIAELKNVMDVLEIPAMPDDVHPLRVDEVREIIGMESITDDVERL